MNNINLIGRMTADVELKQTQSGIEVCRFTLAVRRPKVKDTTDFINCIAWRNTATFISQYFKKGSLVAVSGALTTRKYQDQEGKNRTAFEVIVDNAEFCESKADADKSQLSETEEPQFSTNNAPQFEQLVDDKDLPF